MEQQELESFRQRILNLRVDLQKQEDTAKESSGTVELDQSRMGRLTRMDAMQSQQMALEDVRRRQQQLLKLEGALRRIEAGEYGECFICGEEIDLRRLAVDPTNTRCVGCVGK